MTDETHDTYSGDVTLTGSESCPIAVQNPADVFFRMHSVDGDLEVRNAEYVFTHQSIGDGVDVGTPETTIRGDIEDGYAETDGVSGDAVLDDAGDVFVPADAVGGDLAVVGAENIYSDSVEPGHTPREYDVSLTGWEQTGSATDPDAGVYVTGMSHEVSVDRTRTDIEVYIVGHGHDISVDGRNATVEVIFLGYANTVRLGPYLSADVVAETGFDNEIIEEPYPVEELIEMSKSDAFDNAGFGRRKVTFQVPAVDEDWCRNCGEPADAIIERHQMEAFFLFGHPFKTYERSTNPAVECEHCSPNAATTELSERERRDILG